MSVVPFLDLAMTYTELAGELDATYSRVMASGWYLLGQELTAFEGEFADYVGADLCIGVGSGYDALVLALRALGVSPGDEVIVPANTYVATWLAISAIGATPVGVEPDDTFGIDPSRIESAITSRTRALVPVHLYGHPADLDPIYQIAAEHGLRVLEDAAQAHGSSYRGAPVGSSPDAVAWSFYPSKNLGAFADAGAVTTNDPAVADRVQVLRNYGSRTKGYNEVRGVNSRLDELQAAVLRVKLRRLEEWNQRRRRIADVYIRGCQGLKGLRLPAVSPLVGHAWHLFVVRLRDRDLVQRHLLSRGIQVMVHYPVPPYRQRAYSDLPIPANGFPLSDRIHDEVLSLPIGPHLSVEDAIRVVEALESCCPDG